MFRSNSLVCAVLLLLCAGCGKPAPDPLAEIYDLQGVTVSEDLRPALDAALASLKEPGDAGEAAADIATYYRLVAQIDDPATRRAAGAEVFDLWRAEPDDFLWMQLASNHRYVLRQWYDYDEVTDSPALSDTTGAACAFLQGLKHFGRRSGGEFYELAARRMDGLPPVHKVWLVRKLADVRSARGDDLAAVELLLNWLPTAQKSGGNGLQAVLWRDIALYLSKGDHLDDALAAAVMAIALARSVENHYLALQGEIYLFSILAGRNEFAGAEIQLAKCLESARARRFGRLEVECLNQASGFYGARDDVETALRYDRRCLAMSLAQNDSINVGVNLVNVAYDFMLLGQLDSCKTHMDRAELWIRGVENPTQLRNFPFFAASYYVHVGRYAVADSLIQVALGGLGPGSLAEEKARFLLEQVQTSMRMGRVDQAYRSIAQAQELREAMHDRLPDQNLLADFEIATADLLARQGEFRAAADALERARIAVDRRGGEGKEWEFRRSAGELALLRMDTDDSRSHFERCLTLAEDRGDPALVAESCFLLGTVLLEAGRPDQAGELFELEDPAARFGGRFRTQLAARLYRAISLARQGRHQEAVTALHSLRHSCTPYTPSDIQARLQLELGGSLARLGRFREAEDALLEARRRLVATDQRTMAPNFRLANRTIGTELAEALLGLYFDQPGLLGEKDAGRKTLELLVALKRERAAGAASRVASVASALPIAEPRLVFFVGEKRSFRWAVAGNQVRMSELPGRTELWAKVAPVVTDMARPGRPVDDGALRELSALLFASVASIWPPDTTLYLTADGILGNVPWANLLVSADHAGRGTVHALEYGALCERPLPEAPGVFQAPDRSRTPVPSPRLLTMANNGTMSGEDGDPALPTLRHAQAEVERIAAIWPGQDVVMRLGADSFIAVPGEPDLERFDVIHIATHAQLFEGLPEHSTLRLAAGPGGVPISVSRIAELVLRAELVYLSCCETARSVSGSGALDSFAGACLRAGARSVIASTQRIDDEAAAEFAVLFYRHWLGGESGAAALRAAQLELRAARPAWHHPYFWASYRLIGEGS